MSRQVPNWLDPLNRKEDRKIPPFSVFDIETNNWKEFVVGGYYDGCQYIDYSSIEEFLYYVTDDRVNKTIYAHNGGAFDFSFVLQEVICGSCKDDFEIEGVLPRGSAFLSIEVRRIYKHKDGTVERGCLITFRDSLALLPFSLKSLTENFKTMCAKGEWDHKNRVKHRDDPDLLAYLKADCIRLYQVLEKFFQWPLIRETGVSFTIASQALKVFRSTLNDRILGCPVTSRNPEFNVDKFVRQSYFGGRTEVFRPYFKQPGRKLSCWDVNSLYPSVMRDFEYPTTFKCWSWKYDPKEMGFWEATVEVPKDMYVPPLGTLLKIDKETKKVERVADSSLGKFIFPSGTFSGVWTTIELEYAKSVGVKVLEVGRGAIFENGGYIFREFIDMLYDMRMKAEKDSVDSFICKLLLNSCYGRFGLNLEREQLVVDEGQLGVDLSAYEFKTGRTIEGHDEIFRFVREVQTISSFTNVAIASWVTANARIRMHKNYMKVQDKLYYTDTDSEFILDDGSMESSSKLGEFKYEYSAGEACFILPKAYGLADITGLKIKDEWIKAKNVIKGINKEAIKMSGITVTDLKTLMEGDFKRTFIGPTPFEFKIDEKFSKVKTAMRKGTFLDVQKAQVKKLNAKYDKREIFIDEDGQYNTRPIFIKDGVAVNYRDVGLIVTASGGIKGFQKVKIEEGETDDYWQDIDQADLMDDAFLSDPEWYLDLVDE
jgi:hypothetical protein